MSDLIKVIFSSKLKISMEEVDSLIVPKELQKEDNACVSIISEFSKNFESAKNERKRYEENWKEVDKYVWSDTFEIKKNPKTGKIKKIGETSQNLLWPIFTYKLAELHNQNDTNISITPSTMPQGEFLKQIDEAKMEQAKMIIDGVRSGFIKPEDTEKEIDSAFEEIETMAYTAYIDKIQQFSEITSNVFRESVQPELLKRIFSDALITGTSFAECKHMSNSSGVSVKTTHLPVWNVYLDPNAPSFEHSKFIIVKSITTLDELLADKTLKSYLDANIIENLKTQVQRNKDDFGVIKDSNDSGVDTTLNFYKYYKKYTQKNGSVRYAIYYLVGNDERNPILIYAHKEKDINKFPIVPLFLNKRTNALYGKSMLDFLLPTQKLINKLEAIVKMRAMLSAKPQVFLARNAGIDPHAFSSATLEPGVVHQTNSDTPETAVHIQQLDNIPGDFINFINNAKENLNQIGNMNDAAKGQNAVSGAGTGAVNQTLERALIPEKLNTLDIKEFLKGILVVMIEMITTLDKNQRSIIYRDTKLANQNHNVLFYTGTDFKDLDYNLNVDIKIMTASEKAYELQKLTELYQLGQQFPGLSPAVTPEELITAMDLSTAPQALLRLQAAREQDDVELAQQILQFVGQAIQQGMMAQAEQQMSQLDQEAGNEVDESQLTQAINPEEILQVVVDMLKASKTHQAADASNPKPMQV